MSEDGNSGGNDEWRRQENQKEQEDGADRPEEEGDTRNGEAGGDTEERRLMSGAPEAQTPADMEKSNTQQVIDFVNVEPPQSRPTEEQHSHSPDGTQVHHRPREPGFHAQPPSGHSEPLQVQTDVVREAFLPQGHETSEENLRSDDGAGGDSRVDTQENGADIVEDPESIKKSETDKKLSHESAETVHCCQLLPTTERFLPSNNTYRASFDWSMSRTDVSILNQFVEVLKVKHLNSMIAFRSGAASLVNHSLKLNSDWF